MTALHDMAEAVAVQHRADGFDITRAESGSRFDVRFVTWVDGSLAALADPALTRLVANFGNLRAVIEGERG